MLSEHKSLDNALAAAEDEAEAIGRLAATVQVEEAGTSNVWTVTYHPEPAVVAGTDEMGLPIVEWPCDFRVVHDARSAEVEESTNEAGERLLTTGPLAGEHETWEVKR